jgi:hypothetical protein
MGQLKDRYEAFFQRRSNQARDLEQIPFVLKVAEECDIAISRGSLSDDQIDLLVNYGSSKFAIVWCNVAEMIVRMQFKGIDMSQVLIRLSQSKQLNGRLAAVGCLRSQSTPNAVVDTILIAALNDKSKKICLHAAAIATYYYRKRWLLPLIEKAIAKDPAIARYRDLLRDGYQLEKCEDGAYHLIVLSDVECGTERDNISAEELNTRGIEAIVAEWKNRESVLDLPRPPAVEEFRQSDQ